MVVTPARMEISLRQTNVRAPWLIAAFSVLVACAPTVPESGVGFQDYNTYLRNRELQAQASVTPVPAAPAPAAPLTGFSPSAAAAAIDRADGVTAAPVPLPPQPVFAPPPSIIAEGDRPRGNAPAGIKVESGEMAAVAGTISDEQDFNAVSARESIESDAARIERNRAQYVVIQPGALPVRQGESGPNIVAYALATNNAPGVALYQRSRLRAGDGQAACARYGSPDLAQEAFLAQGGPDRDRKGLDPDGDGFACSWDPRPFRTALQ